MRSFTPSLACCLLLVAIFVAITETARSPPASSSASSSFHVLPVSPSIKLRAVYSGPKFPLGNAAAGPPHLEQSRSKHPEPAAASSRISGPIDFSEFEPDPKSVDSDGVGGKGFSASAPVDGSDDGDLEGAVSESFNPGSGADGDVNAGDLSCAWCCALIVEFGGLVSAFVIVLIQFAMIFCWL
jgi:hypothetical protein